jgi:L-fuculose-phosphate aldolase
VDSRERIIAELIGIGRLLHHSGIFRSRAGNLSARLPDGTLIITRASTHKGLLSRADFMQLAADGTPLDAGTPSSEVALHLGAYASPDIGAVGHAHPIACTELAHRNLVLNVKLAEEGRPVLGAPVLLDDLPQAGRNAGWAAAVADGTRAALLRHHGLVVAGRDPLDVLCKLELCEWLAELQLRLRSRN